MTLKNSSSDTTFGSLLRRRAILLAMAVTALLPCTSGGGDVNVFGQEPLGKAQNLVHAAREQIGVTLYYDPGYTKLGYPGGDVGPERGVCTDVIVRAFRQLKVDLQVLVHEDMKLHFKEYPRRWGLKAPDTNIDHRRVPNLQKFLERQGAALPATSDPASYAPGDIVTWDLGGGVPHIGLVSNKRTSSGIPYMIHNIGYGTREDNMLFFYKITGHYRWFGEKLIRQHK